MIDSSIVVLVVVLVILFVVALGWLTLVSRDK
jgi:Tfp pilus assembly protein PilO